MTAPVSARRPATAGRRLAVGALAVRCPIGVVPIIWNNADLAGHAPPVPWNVVLDEVRRLEYAGLQLGIGFPAADQLVTELAARNLRLAEVYAALPCGPDGPTVDALAIGRARLRELHDARGEVLVVALERSADRDRYVGRPSDAPRLSDDGMAALAAVLHELAQDAARLGHLLAFHNHAATYIETPGEIDRLVAATDPALVGLCLDVGHAILGGGDPEELLQRHANRIVHLHLKDVDPNPMAALRDGRLTGFRSALDERVFAPLGSGLLDLPRVLARLDTILYRGWLMVEQDTSWEPPSEAAAIGRRVLEAALRWTAANSAGGFG